MGLITLAFLVVVVSGGWLWFWSWFWGTSFSLKRKGGNTPPGPRNVLEVMLKLHSYFSTDNLDERCKILEAKYGKVVGFFSFFQRMILISDFQTLDMAFKNPAILGRPSSEFFQMVDDGVYRGITLSSGETWREIRKFTVSQLRSLGLREKTRLNSIISEQVDECISFIRTKSGQPFSTKHFFDIPAVNTLWEIISGQKFSMNDPEAHRLTFWIERVSKKIVQGLLLICHPKFGAWLLAILGHENPFPGSKAHFKTFTSNFLEKRLHSQSLHEETHEDFTQAFIQKIQSTKDVNSPFYGQLGYENFKEVIRDLFVAGSETTSNTISWALLYLALHPEKQEKLQREIDSVLGTQTPSLDDKPKMKYTEAVINETLRKSCVLVFGVPRQATENTTAGRFHIPKGTMVIGNVYAIHHCEKTWGDPYDFRPERFLSLDETTLIKHDEFVPFGIGKRICPGMALAYDELFLFITRIFQEFSITWNPSEPKPNMGHQFKFTAVPNAHTLIFKERKAQTF